MSSRTGSGSRPTPCSAGASKRRRAAMPDNAAPLLEVADLKIEFRSGRETVYAVNGAGFSVRPGETAAILGESGSGKSVTASAIMRILQCTPAFVAGGAIRFKGDDVRAMQLNQWRRRCGREIAMVFQEGRQSDG